MDQLTPKQIVAELDKYIVGQADAKRAVAAARALVRHSTLGTRQIVEESMRIAAAICVYTNEQLTIEELAG